MSRVRIMCDECGERPAQERYMESQTGRMESFTLCHECSTDDIIKKHLVKTPTEVILKLRRGALWDLLSVGLGGFVSGVMLILFSMVDLKPDEIKGMCIFLCFFCAFFAITAFRRLVKFIQKSR
jgi:hypothetical protein